MTALLLSCEHAGNEVPADFAHLFADATEALDSHRGWDPGALTVAQTLALRLAAPLLYTTTTRLLVDHNRSIGHPQLFSTWTRGCSDAERQEILDRFYWPHRQRVIRAVQRGLQDSPLLHVAVHSFTPDLDGVVRNADVGLLYDPGRPTEAHLAGRWQQALKQALPTLRVRRNYPYRGTSDGLQTALRRQMGHDYAGIELELNQATATSAQRDLVVTALASTARETLTDPQNQMSQSNPPQS